MIIGEESEILEFKLSTGERREATESIVAILNKHCKGTLYFGIEDNGYVKGQQVSDSTKRDVSRIINEFIEPKISPTIEILIVDEKQIIKVSFSGHNRPYSCNGKYLIRVGTENRRMTIDDIKKLIQSNDYSSKWEEELTKYTIDDLDEEAIIDFFNSSKKSGRLSMDSYDKYRLLTSLDLIFDDKVKKGCYALFGKNAKISLKLATYATENKITFTDLKLFNGNIYTLINEALQYVLNRINWKMIIGKRKREELPEIPEMALREIIVNAFAHSDYESTPEIEIGIHPGKIEIYNPGCFPEDLTPYDFIVKNLPSYKRNKLILDVLFRSKDVEKSGTGFQRVNELCRECGVLWNFRKEAYGFFFEFIRTNVHENVHIFEQLSEVEVYIYNLIKNNLNFTKSELAKKINKSQKTVQRIISSLVKKDLIVRVGSNKKGYWKVKD